MFMEPGRPDDPALPAMDVSGEPTRTELADLLEGRFTSDPAAEALRLVSGDRFVGIVLRGKILVGGPDSRSDASSGMLGMPGPSSQWNALKVRCPGCSVTRQVLYYDEDDPPQCSDGHGSMDLIPG